MRPTDCVIAFGIPISKEEFFDAKDDLLGRDFVRNRSWGKYYKEVVSHIKEIKPKFEKLKVTVIPGFKLSELNNLLSNNSQKTIILFSHWKGDTMEFFDGMATSDAIVKEIPIDFEGIIDLCVCHPVSLATKLHKKLSPKALVKFTNKENTPFKWLYFYWTVFTILDNSDISYVEALKQSVEAFADMK